MSPATIQALGITQERSPQSWKATGHVEGVGWLGAWGKSLIKVVEVLQALAVERVAEQEEEEC
jgi:hypothetical protein